MDSETQTSSDSISTTWLLIYTAVALFIIHKVCTHLYTLTHFWRMGIPGPLPLPIIGNVISIGKGYPAAIHMWTKKYGKNYGFFGPLPTLVTFDLDFARLILIKEFSSFHSREEGLGKLPYLSDSLVMQSGEHWKRARSYMSPTFSGSKMKQMIPGLSKCCDALLEVVDKKHKNGESFEAKDVFGAYVLDCVACCAFGIEADCQRDPDDVFVKHAKAISSFNFSPVMWVVFIAPFLKPILKKMGFKVEVFATESMDFFANIVKEVVKLRKEGGVTERKDFLQLMIESAEAGGDEQETVKDGANHGVDMTSREVKKKIPQTTDELIGQSIIFFFAGYDTVSTTLSFMAHALATNPEIQKRLQEEIDEMIPEESPVGYDEVFKMEYLDKVWNETMRMWPVGFVLRRCCTQEFTYKGLTIPVGQNIQVDAWDIQHNPEYWREPFTFDPERFNKETKESRHPCAFMPFGAGPRNCVAMRFALLESKMCLIRILQKYSFETTPETQDLLDIANLGHITLYPHKGIHIRVVPRN